jgi:hypothetical protein
MYGFHSPGKKDIGSTPVGVAANSTVCNEVRNSRRTSHRNSPMFMQRASASFSAFFCLACTRLVFYLTSERIKDVFYKI